MSIEDKLTPDQRLRLECLAQAVAYSASHPSREPTTPDTVVATARTFETMVRTNRPEG